MEKLLIKFGMRKIFLKFYTKPSSHKKKLILSNLRRKEGRKNRRKEGREKEKKVSRLAQSTIIKDKMQ